MQVVDYDDNATGDVSMSVAYRYDAAGRLASVKKDDDPAAVYSYDAAGRRTSLALPNGVTTTYTYDVNDRLLDLVTAKDAAVYASFAYQMDPTGNRTGVAYADGSRSLYEFDNAYRLTRDLRLAADDSVLYDESYTYDPLGNRLAKVRAGWNPVNVNYAYNARNQLVATSGTENRTWRYDRNGNPVATFSVDGDEVMVYDVLNRMVRYAGANGIEETTYRGSGWHRWRITAQLSNSAPTITSYLYNDADVVADYNDIDIDLARLYITPELDQNLSMYLISNAGIENFYYSVNGLDSTVELIDDTGQIVDRYDYFAFGDIYYSHNPTLQKFGFQGREFSAIANIIYSRYRYHSPANGRFLSMDPMTYILNPFGNLYLTTSNNPVNRIDPFGLSDNAICCQIKRDIKDPNTTLGAKWQEVSGGGICGFPSVSCVNNCTGTKGGYYENGILTICSNNINEDAPDFSANQILTHELVHAGQNLCHGWLIESCADKICQEIQAYRNQLNHIVVNGEEHEIEFEDFKQSVKNSMGGECSKVFDMIYDTVYKDCISSYPRKPGRFPLVWHPSAYPEIIELHD